MLAQHSLHHAKTSSEHSDKPEALQSQFTTFSLSFMFDSEAAPRHARDTVGLPFQH